MKLEDAIAQARVGLAYAEEARRNVMLTRNTVKALLEALEAPVAEVRVEYACDYPEYFEKGAPRRVRPERTRYDAVSLKVFVDARYEHYQKENAVEVEPARVVKRTVTYGPWEEVE